MGARVGHELPPGDRRRQPNDGPCHGYFRGEHGVIFMGRRRSAERILFLVTARGGWLLRSFSQRRFVSVFRVLRTGDRAEVFSYRRLRLHQQGIRGDEANALFILWRHFRIHRGPYRVRNCRIAGSESALAISIFATTAILGVSRAVSRLRRARWHLAAAYVGTDGSCRGAYSGFHASCRDRDETRLLRRTPRGDEFVSAGLPDVEQVDRLSRGRWDCLRCGGGTPPAGSEICHWLFKRQPHGFRVARSRSGNGAERFRGSIANVFAWRDCGPFVCSRRTHDLSTHTHA